jgi:hypothetical protein
MRFAFLLFAALPLLPEDPAAVRIVKWDRGVALQVRARPELTMYLWFYEWNMFAAMAPGQHSGGSREFAAEIDPGGTTAVLGSPAMRLTARTIPGGADLSLSLTNLSGHDWPELAGVIPCWSPGRVEAGSSQKPASFFNTPRTPQFADPDRNRTFFLSPDGLTRLASRAIHFNSALRAQVDAASDHGQFVFSYKWPTSDVNAKAGILIRESVEGDWVSAVGWADYLSVQGHNPWNCMHVCARVGPLKRKESRTVRGRLYLFRGNKQDCLARFVDDLVIPDVPRRNLRRRSGDNRRRTPTSSMNLLAKVR